MISNDNFNSRLDNDHNSNSASGYAALTPIPLLQSVRVASPCSASWDDMQAVEGERVHFCMGCQKNVYNLSAMSQGEAEGLLRRHEGRLCVRYYQRHDGTVLTGDCPIGAQMVRMGLIRRSAMAAGLFAMLFGAMAAMNLSQQRTTGRVSVAPVQTLIVPLPVIQGDVAPVSEPQPVMGRMRMPEPEPRPMMGAMVPMRPATKEPVAPTPESENLPDPTRDNTSTPSELDTTDTALLRPH